MRQHCRQKHVQVQQIQAEATMAAVAVAVAVVAAAVVEEAAAVVVAAAVAAVCGGVGGSAWRRWVGGGRGGRLFFCSVKTESWKTWGTTCRNEWWRNEWWMCDVAMESEPWEKPLPFAWRGGTGQAVRARGT
jgi:hypothetical protein